MKHKIEQLIRESIETLQHSGEWLNFSMPAIEVTRPKNEVFGDYTTNIALVLAKSVGKSPMEVATVLKEEILNPPAGGQADNSETQDGDASSGLPAYRTGRLLRQLADRKDMLSKIDVVAPGYINFTFSQHYFEKFIATVNAQGNKFGCLETKNKRVMVEYSQLNSHKEFHIGHLRNVFVGSALVRIFEKAGYDVLGVNYCGDTGTHVAKCLWGLVTFHKGEDLESIKNKAEFLGKVYTEASQKIAENPALEDEFKNLQKRFDEGDPELVALWQKTRQWSLDEFDRIYKDLDVSFDTFFYESIEEKVGKEILPELLEKGIVEKSEGAVVANLEKYGLGVLVVMRKDGGVLYGLKDIPLAKEKFERYHIGKSIIVVDIRQALYFKQLFKILELYGFHEEMVHIGYEFVALKGGESMSSRKGNVVTARSLMDYVAQKVQNQFPESPDIKAISIGAIRFAMLKHSVSSRIDFDIDESVRLDGATGPYVQYAYARTASILRKAQEKHLGVESVGVGHTDRIMHAKEIALVRTLSMFPELIEEIAQSYEVHKLPHYAIALADKFHSFYNDCKVIDEEHPDVTAARLHIVQATKIVLSETLRLIGVSAPDKM